MEYTKKMFSLNLAVFVAVKTELMPAVLVDDETMSCYFCFPEAASVPMAIREYKNNGEVKIGDFLRVMKSIRTTMGAVREEYLRKQAEKKEA